MKNSLFFLSIILLSFACGSSKSSTEAAAVQNNDSLPYKLAPVIAESLIKGDEKLLNEHFPTVEIARFLAGGKGKSMTDDEIKDQMLVPLKERFAANLEVIQADMKRLNITAADLEYSKFKYFDTNEPVTVPRALTIYLNNQGKEVQVPTSVLKIHDKWYVFEILMSSGRFD